MIYEILTQKLLLITYQTWFSRSIIGARIVIVKVSGILTRKDVNGIADTVRQTNSIIESVCRENGRVFIANSNIKDSHLNSRGLPLNSSGSLLSQNNFKLSLRT